MRQLTKLLIIFVSVIFLTQICTTTSYAQEETETEKLERLEESGSKDDGYVNYYTIRKMALNDEYDPEVLKKKYETMDASIRFFNTRYTYEKQLIIKKIGIIDKIWKLDDGSSVFTLDDNPSKRFYVYPRNDHFFICDVTEPGDTVQLITTVDRRVYNFDNLTIQRNLTISGDDFIPNHPEDMVHEGYFPSQLYKERLESHNVEKPEWLDIFLSFVDVEKEEQYGPSRILDWVINPDDSMSIDKYLEFDEVADSVALEIYEDNMRRMDALLRLFTHGFDYSNISGYIQDDHACIRTIEKLGDGIVFTTKESPTRRYYLSGSYDPLGFRNLTEIGDVVYMYHDQDRNVYYFDNIEFADFRNLNSPDDKYKAELGINNPNYIELITNYQHHMYKEFPNNVFWSRVDNLPEDERLAYEKFRFPENED